MNSRLATKTIFPVAENYLSDSTVVNSHQSRNELFVVLFRHCNLASWRQWRSENCGRRCDSDSRSSVHSVTSDSFVKKAAASLRGRFDFRSICFVSCTLWAVTWDCFSIEWILKNFQVRDRWCLSKCDLVLRRGMKEVHLWTSLRLKFTRVGTKSWDLITM